MSEQKKDFVTICVACKKGVTRDDMKYVNGRVFHPECYEKQGKDFLVLNQELAKKSALAKIELVQLKNLRARRNSSKKRLKPKAKRKPARKAKRKPARKAKTKRRPARRTRPKKSATRKKRTRTKARSKTKRTSRRPARRRR